MANFNHSVITGQGSNLLARCQTGQTSIRFTKVAVGSGEYTAEDNLIEATALKDIKQQLSYSVIEVINDATVYLGFTVTNFPNNTPLEHGYYITEVGLYAEDDEHNEVLYAIATTEDGQCDYLPAYNGIAPSTITMRFYITATSANPISIVVDSEAHATAEDLNTTNMLVQQAQLDARVAKGFAQTHNTDPEAHQDIRQEMDNLATKEQLNNAISNVITGITAEINIKDEANTIAHNALQQALDDKANYEYIDSVRNELISNIDSRDEANSVTYDNLRKELDTKASTDYVRAEVTNLVGITPATLDTLEELSNALGNDPNFATTVATEIGNKANVDHTHEDLENDITELNNAINEKASKEYVNNATSELNTAIGVTNQQLEELQESVDNKSDVGHGHSVSDISDFPTSLPAEAHQHSANDIIGLPTALPANGGNADTVDNKHANDFVQIRSGMTLEQINDATYPHNYETTIKFGTQLGFHDAWIHIKYQRLLSGENSNLQIAHELHTGTATAKYRVSHLGEWGEWVKIYTSINKPTPADIGAATADHTHDRVNTVKFYPGQLLAGNGNAQYIYAFNGGSDCECYVKPISEIPVASHRHNASDINNVAYTYLSGQVDINDTNIKQFYGACVYGSTSAPNTDWWHIINVPHNDNNGYGGQIAIGYHGNAGLCVRSAAGTSWGSWYDIIGTLNAVNQRCHNITISTAAPSGGSNGDIWIQY